MYSTESLLCQLLRCRDFGSLKGIDVTLGQKRLGISVAIGADHGQQEMKFNANYDIEKGDGQEKSIFR